MEKKKSIKHIVLALVLWCISVAILAIGFQRGMELDDWRVDASYWLSVAGCIIIVLPYVRNRMKRSS